MDHKSFAPIQWRLVRLGFEAVSYIVGQFAYIFGVITLIRKVSYNRYCKKIDRVTTFLIINI